MKYTKWVNGWGLGVAHPPLSEAQWTRDTTVRYVLINTLDAGAVKLKFTNRFSAICTSFSTKYTKTKAFVYAKNEI